MSNYENYTQTSRAYDATRAPVGIEIIIGCLRTTGTELHHQRLLDAGCGTANYTAALLPYVAHIDAIDANPAMLTQARTKLQTQTPRPTLTRASITTLPFADAAFDGIIINQVLHHLDLAPADDYPVYRRVFSEFARVLKPGGAIIVNTCSHHQLRHAFWHYHLIPKQTENMIARHAPLNILKRIMSDAGLPCRQHLVPVDTPMQGDAYFDPRGPLQKSWRDGDSMWSTVPQKTITALCTDLRALEKAGTLQKYLTDHDTHRQHIGQFSFLYGRRNNNPVAGI